MKKYPQQANIREFFHTNLISPVRKLRDMEKNMLVLSVYLSNIYPAE